MPCLSSCTASMLLFLRVYSAFPLHLVKGSWRKQGSVVSISTGWEIKDMGIPVLCLSFSIHMAASWFIFSHEKYPSCLLRGGNFDDTVWQWRCWNIVSFLKQFKKNSFILHGKLKGSHFLVSRRQIWKVVLIFFCFSSSKYLLCFWTVFCRNASSRRVWPELRVGQTGASTPPYHMIVPYASSLAAHVFIRPRGAMTQRTIFFFFFPSRPHVNWIGFRYILSNAMLQSGCGYKRQY